MKRVAPLLASGSSLAARPPHTVLPDSTLSTLTEVFPPLPTSKREGATTAPENSEVNSETDEE